MRFQATESCCWYRHAGLSLGPGLDHEMVDTVALLRLLDTLEGRYVSKLNCL